MSAILLIEDNEAYRRLLQEFLESLGHLVFVAGDGEKGLRIVASLQLDLVITDMMMPRMNGIKFLCGIRDDKHEKFPCKVIAMSGGGVDSQQYLQEAEALGVDVILNKPFDLKELDSQLKLLLLGYP